MTASLHERRPSFSHPTPRRELLGPMFIHVLSARHRLKVVQGIVHGVPVTVVHQHSWGKRAVGGDPNQYRALAPLAVGKLHVDARIAASVDANRFGPYRLLAPIGATLLELRGWRQVHAFSALNPRNVPLRKPSAGAAHTLTVGKAEASPGAEFAPGKMGWFASVGRSARRACLFHELSFFGVGTIPAIYAESGAQPK